LEKKKKSEIHQGRCLLNGNQVNHREGVGGFCFVGGVGHDTGGWTGKNHLLMILERTSDIGSIFFCCCNLIYF
jgi:hypothetical protein